MTQEQPEALRLADEFKLCDEYDSIPSANDIAKAEAELRRLSAENEALRKEISRLEELLSNDKRHTHECTACALAYSPALGESEDCPRCGWDGKSTYVGKSIDAAMKGQS